MKFRPPFMVQTSPKHQENPSEYLIYRPLLQIITNRPPCIYRVSQKKVGSQKTSNCSNSLNFEAKIKCNTIKPNVPKWRKTCTGLKFDLLNFYGPQSNIHTFWDPSFFWLTLYWKGFYLDYVWKKIILKRLVKWICLCGVND